MKLSENYISVLKNFASINPGVVLKPGITQKTISDGKNILVEAELDDLGNDAEFGIEELNQFIGNLSSLSDPDVSFNEKYATMTDGDTEVIYFATSPELIITPPAQDLSMVNPEISFTLTKDTFSKLMKLASMNDFANFSILSENGKLIAKVHNKNVKGGNKASIVVGTFDGEDVTATFSINTLKLLPDDYNVEVKLEKYAKFSGVSRKIVYYISLDA